MTILVTGGAGFIGSNFLEYMMDKYPKDQFICFDQLTYAGNLENLLNVLNNDHFTFIQGNIADMKAVNKVFDDYKIDYVINFAAESHVDNSILNPTLFLETNILGTNNLLLASYKHNIKRFHQVSTDEVYGDLPLDKTGPKFTETCYLKPSSPYSVSKTSADLLVLSYYRTYNLPVTISRCSNNYGPYQYPEKLIPVVISKALKNEPIPVYGTGLNIRDWVHTKDHCRAIDLIVHEGTVGEVYNVGGNCEVTNIDLVKFILKELGKDTSLISYVADRKGHDLRYAMDYTKLSNELGYQPEYTFEKGMKETIQWYIDHPKWLK